MLLWIIRLYNVTQSSGLSLIISAPQSNNAVSTFQIICRVLSFVLDNSWSDEQTINPLPKLIEYLLHVYQTYIQPFSMEVDRREIWHQVDVSTMIYICRYCVFTLWGRLIDLLSNWLNANVIWARTL